MVGGWSRGWSSCLDTNTCSLYHGEHMFGKILLISALTLIAWMFVAHASQGAGPTMRYTVKPGDTLWSIAEQTYGGDPREGIWELRERNRLDTATIVPGQMLVLPS